MTAPDRAALVRLIRAELADCDGFAAYEEGRGIAVAISHGRTHPFVSAWWASWCHLWQILGWCISHGYRDNGPARDVADHDDPNDSPYTDPVL